MACLPLLAKLLLPLRLFGLQRLALGAETLPVGFVGLLLIAFDLANASCDRVAIGARLDVSIHDALREISFRDRISINALIIEGLEYVISKRKP
ncbi:MAG: hypothetical protein CMM42_00030 [Rhodospirillaceae bacterium]|nr:hypothetical protein [Rhodospirillaceae bacterium]|tara:strand:+ start:177 stop:458 length:282 start_codon:yes stop_codon:yes gene_type:complete